MRIYFQLSFKLLQNNFSCLKKYQNQRTLKTSRRLTQRRKENSSTTFRLVFFDKSLQRRGFQDKFFFFLLTISFLDNTFFDEERIVTKSLSTAAFLEKYAFIIYELFGSVPFCYVFWSKQGSTWSSSSRKKLASKRGRKQFVEKILLIDEPFWKILVET